MVSRWNASYIDCNDVDICVDVNCKCQQILVALEWFSNIIGQPDRGCHFISLGTLHLHGFVCLRREGKVEKQLQVLVFFKHLQVFMLLSRREESRLEIDVMIIQSALANES